MPMIADASSGTLKLGASLDKRMPAMPGGRSNELAFSKTRQEETEKLMTDMRVSYDITRRQNARSKAIARKRNRQTQKQAERR